jgi:hypothetical protein
MWGGECVQCADGPCGTDFGECFHGGGEDDDAEDRQRITQLTEQERQHRHRDQQQLQWLGEGFEELFNPGVLLLDGEPVRPGQSQQLLRSGTRQTCSVGAQGHQRVLHR